MTPDDLSAALDQIADPLTGQGLVAAGRISAPKISGSRVDVVLDVGGLDPAQRAGLEAQVSTALSALSGIEEVRVLLTAERREQVRKILAIASGKGGVGKSTVSANLAIALARTGLKVGVVDADIYGPSQPRLLDAQRRPEAYNQKPIPVPTRFGVRLLSIGQLVEVGKAIAWRGPMAAGALSQLMDADWGDTELLVLDLPPGTGDVQLTMIQKHKPVGAIIVSTPQDLALIDAERAIDLFVQSDVPILGIVENMAGYVCPHCGEISDPFGAGGAEAEAERRGVPFLGRIPLTIDIRKASDAGEPPAAGFGPEGEPFHLLAQQVRALL